MIEQSMLDTVRRHVAGLARAITLVFAPGEYEHCDELRPFFSGLSSDSGKIVLDERPFATAHGPISCMLEADGQEAEIVFSGIPG